MDGRMRKDWVVFAKGQPPLSSVASMANVVGPDVGDALVLRIWYEWLRGTLWQKDCYQFST